MLLKYKQGIQKQQAIVPLDRHRDLPKCTPNGVVPQVVEPQPSTSSADGSLESSVFRLKRSGRVIRTIDNAPPRTQRTWLSPSENFTIRELMEKQKRNAPPTLLDEHQLIGEILHIIRPVVHLTGLVTFGTSSWAPYLVSFGLDLTSLKLLSDPPNKQWNVNERIELGQRSFAILLYLLRSPFYDRFTKEKVLNILRFLSEHIPLFGRLVRPLIDYLPEWQRTYFYVWGI